MPDPIAGFTQLIQICRDLQSGRNAKGSHPPSFLQMQFWVPNNMTSCYRGKRSPVRKGSLGILSNVSQSELIWKPLGITIIHSPATWCSQRRGRIRAKEIRRWKVNLVMAVYASLQIMLLLLYFFSAFFPDSTMLKIKLSLPWIKHRKLGGNSFKIIQLQLNENTIKAKLLIPW